jgi:hypothetical protein
MKVFLKFICVLFALQVQISFSQELTQKKNNQFNLPPGFTLYPKTDSTIDYSEKLFNEPNYKQIGVVNRQFKSVMTEENYVDMQLNDMDSYNYYKEAEVYFDRLSDKVKAIYTADEIWYIYYFDTNLKNQLLSVK